MNIRRVADGHPALRALHRETLPSDRHPAYASGWWWLAFDGERPVAFAGMQPSSKWSDCAYMVRCGVAASHRGRGLQKRLIQVRLAHARSLGLRWVITSTLANPASANNLIDCGFRMYEPAEPWASKGTLYWKRSL